MSRFPGPGRTFRQYLTRERGFARGHRPTLFSLLASRPDNCPCATRATDNSEHASNYLVDRRAPRIFHPRANFVPHRTETSRFEPINDRTNFDFTLATRPSRYPLTRFNAANGNRSRRTRNFSSSKVHIDRVIYNLDALESEAIRVQGTARHLSRRVAFCSISTFPCYRFIRVFLAREKDAFSARLAVYVGFFAGKSHVASNVRTLILLKN